MENLPNPTKGSAIARTFLQIPGWRIRGTTRNPSSPSALALQSQGIEVVKVDLDSVTTLLAAFQNATAIFGLTDFWEPYFSPTNQELAKKTGKTINEIAYETEIQHGINIATAASQIPTLTRYIYSSLADVKSLSNGKYTQVYHFDSKAQVVHYIKQHLPALFQKSSFLQVGEYVTNWKKMVTLGPKKLKDGTFVIRKPHAGDAKIPMVWVEAEPGKTLLGYGSLIGWEEFLRIWGEILGVKTRFEEVPVEEYLVDFPEDLRRELRETGLVHGELGWDGGDPDVIHPEDVSILPLILILMVELFTDEDAAGYLWDPGR